MNFYQLRLLIAKRLLHWAHNIAPSDEANGEQIKGSVLKYFKTVQAK